MITKSFIPEDVSLIHRLKPSLSISQPSIDLLTAIKPSSPRYCDEGVNRLGRFSLDMTGTINKNYNIISDVCIALQILWRAALTIGRVIVRRSTSFKRQVLAHLVVWQRALIN